MQTKHQHRIESRDAADFYQVHAKAALRYFQNYIGLNFPDCPEKLLLPYSIFLHRAKIRFRSGAANA
jgi:hypothetical protein